MRQPTPVIEHDQTQDEIIRALADYVEQGISIARAATRMGISPEDVYQWADDPSPMVRPLRDAVHSRNKRFGIGWTDALAAASTSSLPPGAKRKRKALDAERKRGQRIAGKGSRI
jgi:Transposase